MKGVIVEQDSTTSVVGSAQVIREALVLQVLDRLLWRDDMPFAWNVLFNGPCSASSSSRIPAQCSWTCLHK